MAGSQKITLWGPQRTPLGILRVKQTLFLKHAFQCDMKDVFAMQLFPGGRHPAGCTA